MKTKLLFCAGYFLLTTSLLGQGVSDAFMKQITRETCNELTNVDFSSKTPEELKVSLGLALVKVMGQHQSELKSFGVSMTDGKGVEKLATDVGMRLVTDCPPFVDALTKNPNTIKELAQTHSATGRISGKLVKIVGGEFTHLQVEDTKGKIEKL